VREVEHIARLLERSCEGTPYYGPSVLGALENVSAETAARAPGSSTHSIWSLVAHLTAELRYAAALLDDTAGPWIEGQTTWPSVTDTSAMAWQHAIDELTEANRTLVRMVEQLDDAGLERELSQVRWSYYDMLHGTVQHNVYHAGQISLLKRQATASGT
jgi:uncharacterized damage-inducible protein DinB